MPVVGVDHVQVAGPRGCEEAARRFYGDLLGLPELPKPELLRSRGRSRAARCAPRSSGSSVTWDTELGVRRFYTEDPWGNRLELLA